MLDVVVTPELTVHFEELGSVHPVYATYNMAKHFEEAGRKLLLRHLDPDEDGLGRSVAVEHLAPSWVGDRLTIEARCAEVQGQPDHLRVHAPRTATAARSAAVRRCRSPCRGRCSTSASVRPRATAGTRSAADGQPTSSTPAA